MSHWVSANTRGTCSLLKKKPQTYSFFKYLNYEGHGMWLDEDLKMDAKRLLFPKDWTTCSKYVDHSRFSNRHKDPLMSKKVFI